MTPQTRSAATPGGHGGSPPSKQALFDAARQLFSQNGFKRTTTREIAELAGVDAALIARYFGSKADLYVAVVAADRMDDQDAATAEGVETPYRDLAHISDILIRRSDEHGLGPVLHSLIHRDTSDEITEAARHRMARRLVEPLADGLPDDLDDATLRAEIAISALLGVTLSRTLGWFDHIQSVPRERLVELVNEALSALLPDTALASRGAEEKGTTLRKTRVTGGSALGRP